MSEGHSSISPPPKRQRLSKPPVIDLTSQGSEPAAASGKLALVDLTADDRGLSTDAEPDEDAIEHRPMDCGTPCHDTVKLASPDIDSPQIKHPDPIPTTSFCNTIPSPMQLNMISELPMSGNQDTITLAHILGDPLIKECWLFNYLFDVDFILSQFDSDVRHTVRIKIIHGSWRADDMNGIGIAKAASSYPNIENIKAHMPEAFGTHHSKMIIYFRHDGLARVVITTGNFIERDWRMSQAFWCSPLLPLDETSPCPMMAPVGSGLRFQYDLLSYIRHYGSKLNTLHDQLQSYDFAGVRGALVASVPIKQDLMTVEEQRSTAWGHLGLKSILDTVPLNSSASSAHIVSQISSVASVGQAWLQRTFFTSLNTIKRPVGQHKTHAKHSIIFPTSSEIRTCIGGYNSGASIHMKTQSTANMSQVNFLKPMLCHWASTTNSSVKGQLSTLKPRGTTSRAKAPSQVQASGMAKWLASKPSLSQPSHASSTLPTPNENAPRRAKRGPAAPHIKTYIRFTSEACTSIDWAMVTSANLSTQAWGSAPNPNGEVRICSYEIGVVVWPDLWKDEDDDEIKMVPCFLGNGPSAREIELAEHLEKDSQAGNRVSDTVADANTPTAEKMGHSRKKRYIGWRMPYDLPLVPYAADEMPWCATSKYREPDCLGRTWDR
ncbi:uncharacterized protein KY384_003426 [Bacidia gigantensis]|uniref:uncharacterized protein n=1 Tax=Bacidia gigantensis TaxID=2732470 RepID=UPI001D052A82|nr:uncharacterized protein KY384_003426 [Bacidia gigantensis]KAG8531790.1 hypothetical protein KY384_003426 [Bacidia gigantensis]